ncbi:hypothetical protein [Runella limosa]|uniref:hypothetical protein n=1 Tax=Runella limosa TaxID=370978 RepID=UPI001B7FD383|nr:hypothetical protein [Runella limosa]
MSETRSLFAPQTGIWGELALVSSCVSGRVWYRVSDATIVLNASETRSLFSPQIGIWGELALVPNCVSGRVWYRVSDAL